MKKFIKVLLILFIALGLISSKFDVAKADDEFGTISVHITAEDLFDPEAAPMALPGMEFDVYQIWKVVDGQIVFNDHFAGVTEIDGEMSSNEIQKKASDFLNVSYGAPKFTTIKTDDNGMLSIDVPLGAYLFVQTETLEYNDEAFNATPFLVTVPFKDPVTEEYTNIVDATPKVAVFRTLPSDKTVNDEYDYDVNDFEDELKYTITTDMPLARSKFVVTDEMEPVLIFPKDKELKEFVSVKFNGVEIPEDELKETITLNEHSIVYTASEKHLQEKQGQEFVLEFTALLDKTADLTPYLEGVPNDFEIHIDDKVLIESEPCKVNPPKRRRIPDTAAWLLEEARENPQVFYPVSFLFLGLIIMMIKFIVDRRKNRYQH